MKNRQPQSSSLADVAYSQLREKLLSGDTSTTLLSEGQIARELGMSRTPVRSALLLLEKEGLVKRIPKRGYVVVSKSIHDVFEIFELREALHGLAARLAASRMTDQDICELENLKNSLEAPDLSANSRFALERRFHSYLVGCARNKRLEQVCARVEDNVIFLIGGQTVHLLGKQEDFRNIVDALKSRDPDKAEAVVREHIRNGGGDILRSFGFTK